MVHNYPRLQNIVEMKVGVSTPSENIPLNPGAVREKSNAIQMADGYSQIWWPALMEVKKKIVGRRCLIWEGTIPMATQNEIDNNPTRVIATLVVDYTIIPLLIHGGKMQIYHLTC